ncbi:MAG: nucleotide exchange factor GrpE [Hyphomicrobiales bacterium]|nr:MAG: nucleotide exchange factor GrpE [Hyphomicrobiales bacterium]
MRDLATDDFDDKEDFDAASEANDERARMAPSEAEAAAEAIQAAATQIETLTDEVASLKDRLLREMAEMENLRRRSAKEKIDANKFAITGFARDMISVGDNLNRALQALPADVRENAADEIKNLFTGVEMTNQEMLNVFDRHGIKQINPMDEKFNPNFHQAMFEVPNIEIANGTVVEVVQVGYAIDDRVLRPALVGVSKGGPKIVPQSIAEPDPAEPNLGGSIDTSA